MRKTIILTYVILFIISPTVQSKSHSEDISYTDIIGICINGINNIKALKKGGYLVIYVPYYPLYIQYMKNHKHIKHIGKITYKFDSEKKMRDLDVWQKI